VCDACFKLADARDALLRSDIMLLGGRQAQTRGGSRQILLLRSSRLPVVDHLDGDRFTRPPLHADAFDFHASVKLSDDGRGN